MSAVRLSARADQTTVRRVNLSVVLQQVASDGPRSRARIAAETGLTRGTVSSLVSELIDLDLIRETGEEERPGGVGRPAQTLELHDRVVAIGLEVNVDYLAVCTEDLTGQVRFERRIYTDNRLTAPGPVIDSLAELAGDAIEDAIDQGLVIAGLAVAVPGLTETASGTLLRAPNLGWSGVAVVDELRERIGAYPISVENEANLAALAELRLGAGRDVRSFICVFGEVGVGAGIVIDGELFRGAHGFGGELGHMTVDRDGAACACGSRGCLETLVGQEAIASRAGIARASGGRTRSVTAQLVRRAEAGDSAVVESLRDAGTSLGIGLAAAVNLLDVDAVVLGGCFGPLTPWLRSSVIATLETRVLAAGWTRCDVRASALGEGAAVRGAAALTLRSVLASPWIAAAQRRSLRELVV